MVDKNAGLLLGVVMVLIVALWIGNTLPVGGR